MRIVGATFCSGIGCAEVAAPWIDWRLESEIEAFPRAVLAHRFGAVDARRAGAAQEGVPLWGDFTALRPRHFARLGIELPDVLVAGTPCQAFSIAGLRRSLDDDRGTVTLDFVRQVHAIDNARRHRGLTGLTVVWENVPDVLSTSDNAFGCFIGGLVGADSPIVPPRGLRWTSAGHAVGPRRAAAWRILDAQYFDLAQRRARLYVVSCPLDGPDPREILFERDGMRRDSAPRREAGQEVAGTLGGSSQSGGFRTTDLDNQGAFIAYGNNRQSGQLEVAGAVRGHEGNGYHNDFERETLLVRPGAPPEGFAFKASHYTHDKDGAPSEITPPLSADADKGDQDTLICAPFIFEARVARNGRGAPEEICPPLKAESGQTGKGDAAPLLANVTDGWAVRRLMPVECERLQGLPDHHTLVPWRGKPEAPDGPRYRAIGNGMPVRVMAWILGRLREPLLAYKAAS